jgi:hypothetical protein
MYYTANMFLRTQILQTISSGQSAPKLAAGIQLFFDSALKDNSIFQVLQLTLLPS